MIPVTAIATSVLVPTGLACQFLAAKRGVLGKGKILTKPMVMAAIRRAARWVESGDIPRAAWWLVAAQEMRIIQLLCLFFVMVQGAVTAFLIHNWTAFDLSASIYWLGFFSLYLDDLLTGEDDDRWKRRFKALKNKVVWKWVPAPQPIQIRG